MECPKINATKTSVKCISLWMQKFWDNSYNKIKYYKISPSESKKKKKMTWKLFVKSCKCYFFFFFCHHLCSPDYFQFGNWKWHVVLLKNKLFKIKYAWLLRELTFLKKKKNKKWKSCSWLCLLKLKKEKSLHVLSAKLTAS